MMIKKVPPFNTMKNSRKTRKCTVPVLRRFDGQAYQPVAPYPFFFFFFFFMLFFFYLPSHLSRFSPSGIPSAIGKIQYPFFNPLGGGFGPASAGPRTRQTFGLPPKKKKKKKEKRKKVKGGAN